MDDGCSQGQPEFMGGWKDYITTERVAMLDSNYEKRLKAVGLELQFK